MFLVSFCVAFIVAFIVALILVLFFRGHSDDVIAVQATHLRPTPRVGGVAIAGGLIAGAFLVPSEYQWLIGGLLASTVPVWLVGLAEDLTRAVSAKRRYMAALVSGALAILFFGVWIDRMDAPVLGYLVGFMPIGIALTLFTTASFSHAFNLIDGLNGLSSGFSVVASIGLWAIAMQNGQFVIANAALLHFGAVLGFAVLNYPFGRIFLGDAGAYSLGHLLSWLGLLLYAQIPILTCWALLLVMFWPMADTIFAIGRRVSQGNSFDVADRMHAHHVVMRALEIKILGRKRRHVANPVATLMTLPVASVPTLLGVLFWNDPTAAFCALVVCAVGYVAVYRAVFRLAVWGESAIASDGMSSKLPSQASAVQGVAAR